MCCLIALVLDQEGLRREKHLFTFGEKHLRLISALATDDSNNFIKTITVSLFSAKYKTKPNVLGLMGACSFYS